MVTVDHMMIMDQCGQYGCYEGFNLQTVLNASEHYNGSMSWVRRMSTNISMSKTRISQILNSEHQVNVLPYSVFYVFYDRIWLWLKIQQPG